MSERAESLWRLESDGLITRRGGSWRTTRRFQAAMARASLSLYRSGQDLSDLRLPIAVALLDVYREIADRDLASLTEAVLPIEARELAPFGARAG